VICEGTYLKVLADHFVAEDLITTEERTGLPSLRYRRRARKQMKKQHGRKALRGLRREQVRLLIYHGRYGAGPQLADHEYAVRHARAELVTAERAK
jgi:hypothetical protein